MITKRQKQVLDYVTSFHKKKGYSPTLEEISKHFKFASVSTPYFHIRKLQELGFLEKRKNKPRSIAVSGSKLPCFGEFYALRVIGNSMVDKNISDGDIILVKQQSIAENEKKLRAEKILTVEETKREKKLPLNKIILGDAVKELRKLPDSSCDVIIIDPPYNIGKNFGNNIDRRELNEYIEWSKNWINDAVRIIKPTGTIFIYGFSEILAYLSVEIPINKRWLIWHYTNKNVASLNFWQRSHEAIICAWKNKPIFNRDEIREPYTQSFLNGAAGKVRKGTLGRFSKEGKETIYKAHEQGALPRDVIKVPALAGGAGMIERWFLCETCNDVFEPKELKNHLKHKVIKHPTQKPLELTRKLIKSAMPPQNGIVLVPFVGSGSECVIAKELGLSYLGYELNPDYIRIADKWLEYTR